MNESLSIEVKDPKGRELWVACGGCGRSTCHRVLSVVASAGETPDQIKYWDDYLTIQCGGCHTVSFCVESSCSEGTEYNPRTQQEELAITHRVYPNRIAGRSALEHCQLLPYGTYRVYEETRKALSDDQPVLAGIGIRAIIETVCKERSAAGKDLKQKIDDLATKGIVTMDGAKILHSLRFMGNDAAHEVKAHTQEDLLIALDVAEYTLKGVYILPKLADKLPKK